MDKRKTMNKAIFFSVIFLIMVVPVMAGRNALTPAGGIDRYSSERNNIFFLDAVNNATTTNYFQKIIATQFCFYNGSCLSLNGSGGGGGTGPGKAGAAPWLYNDTTSIYWNSTYGNNTYCLITELTNYTGNWSAEKDYQTGF